MKTKICIRLLAALVCLCALAGLVACAGADISGVRSKAEGILDGIGYGSMKDSAAYRAEAMEIGKGGDTENGNAERPGTLTAGAWNDNQYYTAWKQLFLRGQNSEEDHKFALFMQSNPWKLDSLQRIKVTVANEAGPLAGIQVVCKDEAGNRVFSAVTDARGEAFLFPTVGKGTVSIPDVQDAVKSFDENRDDIHFVLPQDSTKVPMMELMFVVDATGSMGDEITFLQAELKDVIEKVRTSNPQTKIMLSFLFYRDDGDAEKFTFSDFCDITDTANYNKQQAYLAKQEASGGGDYEEAVDEALERAVNAQWTTGNTTKLLFLVLDAPAHSTDKNVRTYYSAVKTAAEKGIRICPVIASGADTLCEYMTRTAAILTGGTFVFLTDDSGVGGEHLDVSLPNAVIENLNALLVRLINGYYTGEFANPEWFSPNEAPKIDDQVVLYDREGRSTEIKLPYEVAVQLQEIIKKSKETMESVTIDEPRDFSAVIGEVEYSYSVASGWLWIQAEGKGVQLSEEEQELLGGFFSEIGVNP